MRWCVYLLFVSVALDPSRECNGDSYHSLCCFHFAIDRRRRATKTKTIAVGAAAKSHQNVYGTTLMEQMENNNNNNNVPHRLHSFREFGQRSLFARVRYFVRFMYAWGTMCVCAHREYNGRSPSPLFFCERENDCLKLLLLLLFSVQLQLLLLWFGF